MLAVPPFKALQGTTFPYTFRSLQVPGLHLCCEPLCHVPGYFCCVLPNRSVPLPYGSCRLLLHVCVFSLLFLSEDQSTLQRAGFVFRLHFLWSKTQSLSSQSTVYTQHLVSSCINNENKLDSNCQYCSSTRVGT